MPARPARPAAFSRFEGRGLSADEEAGMSRVPVVPFGALAMLAVPAAQAQTSAQTSERYVGRTADRGLALGRSSSGPHRSRRTRPAGREREASNADGHAPVAARVRNRARTRTARTLRQAPAGALPTQHHEPVGGGREVRRHPLRLPALPCEGSDGDGFRPRAGSGVRAHRRERPADTGGRPLGAGLPDARGRAPRPDRRR